MVNNCLNTLEMNFKLKRRLLFGVAAGYSLLGGAEYVTILPTVWPYLQSLDITEGYWLGFVTSVYSFASAISGIIGGRLADKYVNHSKTIVLISILIRTMGNFQYTLGGSISSILFARLLCGLGNAGGTVLLAEVCRTTTRSERTAMLAICNGAFDVGVLIGPALQYILTYLNFDIFYFHITPTNGPGLLLGSFWLIFLTCTLFLLFNLAEEFEIVEAARRAQLSLDIESFEEKECKSDSEWASEDSSVVNNSKDGVFGGTYLEEFLTDKFVLLLSLAFIANFCVSGFDTVIPVITQEHFNYGVFENSLIYMVGGVEAVSIFFILTFSSKYFSDTALQLLGWFLILTSQVWFLIVIPTLKYGGFESRIYFLVGVAILFLGNPIAFAANASLSSKVLSSKTQGLGQGISRLAIYSGLVYGPAWEGAAIKNCYLFLGVPIAILLVNGVMLLWSYGDLRRSEHVVFVPKEKYVKSSLCDSGIIHDSQINTKESVPLLSHRQD